MRIHLRVIRFRSLLAVCSMGLVHCGSMNAFASFEKTIISEVAAQRQTLIDIAVSDAEPAIEESLAENAVRLLSDPFASESRKSLFVAQGGPRMKMAVPPPSDKRRVAGVVDDDDAPPPKKNTPDSNPLGKEIPGLGAGGRQRPPVISGTDPYVSKFPAGSIDDVLSTFCTAVEDDDFATASDFIAQNVKGTAGMIRDGQLSDEKMTELKNAISPISELTPKMIRGDASKRTLINVKKGQVITFNLKKEKDVYRITDIGVATPKKLPAGMLDTTRRNNRNDE